MTVYALESERSFDADQVQLKDYQQLAAMTTNQRKKYYNYLGDKMRRMYAFDVSGFLFWLVPLLSWLSH